MNGDALEVYERHVSGVPMRELAREKNVQPSTIMRQTRRVEEARSDPVMDKYMTEREEGGAMPDDKALSALVEMSRRPNFEVVVARDLSMAGVIDKRTETVVQAAPVLDVGALIGHGYLRKAKEGRNLFHYKSKGDGKNEFDETGKDNLAMSAAESRQRAARNIEKRNEVLLSLRRRKWLTDEHIGVATDLMIEWESYRAGVVFQTVERFIADGSPMARAFAELQPGLRDVVEAIILEGETGLEQFEKDIGWPARSAKVMLRYAIEALIQIRNEF